MHPTPNHKIPLCFSSLLGVEDEQSTSQYVLKPFCSHRGLYRWFFAVTLLKMIASLISVSSEKRHAHTSMRALWSDRHNCLHNVFPILGSSLNHGVRKPLLSATPGILSALREIFGSPPGSRKREGHNMMEQHACFAAVWEVGGGGSRWSVTLWASSCQASAQACCQVTWDFSMKKPPCKLFWHSPWLQALCSTLPFVLRLRAKRYRQDVGKGGVEFKGGSRHDRTTIIAETVTAASLPFICKTSTRRARCSPQPPEKPSWGLPPLNLNPPFTTSWYREDGEPTSNETADRSDQQLKLEQPSIANPPAPYKSLLGSLGFASPESLQ